MLRVVGVGSWEVTYPLFSFSLLSKLLGCCWIIQGFGVILMSKERCFYSIELTFIEVPVRENRHFIYIALIDVKV